MHSPAEAGSQQRVGPGAQWRELLCQACQVLAMTPGVEVAGCSVTKALTGGPEEGRAAVVLAERLAQEHGLRMDAQVSDGCLTVHLRRAGPLAD